MTACRRLYKEILNTSELHNLDLIRSHYVDSLPSKPSRAEKPIAQPAAIVALVRANFSSIKARKHARLLQASVQADVPAVSELVDADALLRRREVALRATTGSSDDGAVARAICIGQPAKRFISYVSGCDLPLEVYTMNCVLARFASARSVRGEVTS